ncbi:MAG TPA: hypothetical protein VGA87_11415, partial [Pyrinomonadaceae bacterium]
MSFINAINSYRLRAGVAGAALLMFALTFASSTAYAGKDCSSGFTVTLSDNRTFSGTRDTNVSVGAGQTAVVRGQYVTFTINLDTFAVTNYTLNSDITAGQPRVIFLRKQPLHGKVLTGSLHINLNSEQAVF